MALVFHVHMLVVAHTCPLFCSLYQNECVRDCVQLPAAENPINGDLTGQQSHLPQLRCLGQVDGLVGGSVVSSETPPPTDVLLSHLSLAFVLRPMPHVSKMAASPPASPPASSWEREAKEQMRKACTMWAFFYLKSFSGWPTQGFCSHLIGQDWVS